MRAMPNQSRKLTLPAIFARGKAGFSVERRSVSQTGVGGIVPEDFLQGAME